MLHINEAIIVEGKYDKMQLEKICDAQIFTTEGFRIFKSTQKREFLKKLADKCGILVLTDSDRAGFLIRNHLKGFIDEGKIRHAYIPEIIGKEKRKTAPSKEGKLGVEGIDLKILEKVLLRFSSGAKSKDKITKSDLFDAKLYGGTQSAAARLSLCRHIGVPSGISVNALIDALNALMTKDEFFKLTGDLNYE